MRLRVSCICLTLRQGTIISIIIDIIKILIAILLLVVYVTTGYDRGFNLQTQAVSTPSKLTDGSAQGSAILSVIVIFIGDLARYSVVGIVGVTIFFKGLVSIHLGTYFWVKFLQSFLNIFSSLLMVTLVQLPISDMIQSLATFAVDQYFCLIVYSYWQAKKVEEGYVSPFDEIMDTEDEEEFNILHSQFNRNAGQSSSQLQGSNLSAACQNDGDRSSNTAMLGRHKREANMGSQQSHRSVANEQGSVGQQMSEFLNRLRRGMRVGRANNNESQGSITLRLPGMRGRHQNQVASKRTDEVELGRLTSLQSQLNKEAFNKNLQNVINSLQPDNQMNTPKGQAPKNLSLNQLMSAKIAANNLSTPQPMHKQLLNSADMRAEGEDPLKMYPQNLLTQINANEDYDSLNHNVEALAKQYSKRNSQPEQQEEQGGVLNNNIRHQMMENNQLEAIHRQILANNFSESASSGGAGFNPADFSEISVSNYRRDGYFDGGDITNIVRESNSQSDSSIRNNQAYLRRDTDATLE